MASKSRWARLADEESDKEPTRPRHQSRRGRESHSGSSHPPSRDYRDDHRDRDAERSERSSRDRDMRHGDSRGRDTRDGFRESYGHDWRNDRRSARHPDRYTAPRPARSRSRSPRRSLSPLSAAEEVRQLTRGPSAGKSGQAGSDETRLAPNFERSGLLAAESNNVGGVALKYHEPPEARKAKRPWRLYVFKGGEQVDMKHVSLQSCHLFGRDRTVVDVPLDHPSCSKQHAALQFRLVVERNEFGDAKRTVRYVSFCFLWNEDGAMVD